MSFNITDAIQFAKYSSLAYNDNNLPSNCELISGLPKSDTQCLVIEEKDKIIFSFRGTNDFKKYIIDAQIKFKKLGSGIKVHSGFYNALDSVWLQLSDIAEKTKLPIYTTGHSLGAALSRLFTYRLTTEKYILVKESYSYGEPRSFNRAGANLYDSLQIPTYRFIDKSDIVPRIPWRCGLYKHVNHELFIDEWNNLVKDEPWWAHIPSDLADIIKELFRNENAPIADHSIDRYIENLQKIQYLP